ncbi:MAG: Ldh family oxidoreductase [Gammaproteobacteria bacterium]|nr:Ldh family oxidoreductase [Gammaproteobacteria bacterium]
MSRKITVPVDELKDLVERSLLGLGLRADESRMIGEVLMYAELRGTGQGLIKILEKTVVPDPDRTPLSVRQCAPAVHHIEANGNAGMVVMTDAADLTIETCRSQGLALTGTCQTATSTGSIGFYAHRLAAAGFIGMVLAGSPKVMSLYGGSKATLGTNPVAFAIPTGSDPLVFDMATAAITWFDVIQAQRDGESIPTGVARDAGGQPTTDPAAALTGMLSTFGGSKGSGLALMFEILTGPLMQASMFGDAPDNRGNFLFAIDPTLLAPDFCERVGQLLTRIREGEPDTFRLPGERSQNQAAAKLADGYMALSASVYEQLRQQIGLPG